MEALLVLQECLGGVEDHLRGEVHGDGARQLIVDGGMVVGAEEENGLHQEQGADDDGADQPQAAEDNHDDHVHGDHGADGELSQHRPREEQDGRQADAVHPHDPDPEELLAQGLAVLQKQGDEEFQDEVAQKNGEGDDDHGHAEHHIVGVDDVGILGVGLVGLLVAFQLLLREGLQLLGGDVKVDAVLLGVLRLQLIHSFNVLIVIQHGRQEQSHAHDDGEKYDNVKQSRGHTLPHTSSLGIQHGLVPPDFAEMGRFPHIIYYTTNP